MNRHLRAIIAASVLLMSLHATRAGDAFPSRPIKIVVNTAPGGFTDLMARLGSQYMSEYLNSRSSLTIARAVTE